MLLLDLLLDAESDIASRLFSIPFVGFQSRVGFSIRSRLCVIAPFLTAVPLHK